jgi:methylated-DNA-[protein]-cysteine S-methyltransferase
MTKLYVHSFETEIGRLRIASTDEGVALIMLPTDSEDQFERLKLKYFAGYSVENGGKINYESEVQLKSYMRGELREFSLPLDWRGTPFQQKVLRKVAQIPYGRTMTYGEIAAAVGAPGASRAVGHANARNLIPLVVPCHRVVASNGLGGYGGGIELKRRLLIMERAL